MAGVRHRAVVWACVGAVAFGWLIAPAGCGSSETPPAAVQEAAPHPRVVSLSPALTRMVRDLGEGEHLVGVAQHDDATLGLPVCGNFLDPDVERILALEPDIVLTETAVTGGPAVPARLLELESAGALHVVAVPQVRSIADVKEALTHPGHGLGVLFEAEAAARALSHRMDAELLAVQQAVSGLPRPRVLMLLSTAPMAGIGPGVTHDQLLTMAGGVNALADAGVGYVTLDRQMLIERVRPDVILLIAPAAPALTEDDARLRPLDGLPIRAVIERRVVLVAHPQALLPSTSLPAVLAEMARALHPDRAEAIDLALQSVGEAAQTDDPQAAP
jgi:iron complex transport system substrate-binding protein